MESRRLDGPPASDDPLDGTSTVLLRGDRPSRFSLLAADETTLYLGGEKGIVALPKTGGSVRPVCPDVDFSTTGIAADDTDSYVYFTRGAGFGRVPKSGGECDDLRIVSWSEGTVEAPALDEMYVYVATDALYIDPDTEAALWESRGDKPLGAVVRIPRAGGAGERLALWQSSPSAVALDEEWVYFSTQVFQAYSGYPVDPPYSTISRVRKTGGPIEVLADHLVDRVSRLVVAHDAIWYVEQSDQALMRLPLSGGAAVKTGPSTLETPLAQNGGSVFAASLAIGGKQAALVELDPAGRSERVLATWSYAWAKLPPSGWSASGAIAATAIVADSTRVYWLDYARDDLHEYQRSTLRSAPR